MIFSIVAVFDVQKQHVKLDTSFLNVFSCAEFFCKCRLLGVDSYILKYATFYHILWL